MRFALTVIGVLTSGGWAVGAHQGVLPPPQEMLRAVTALGGDPAQLKNIEIRPIQETYNNVMRKVTTGAPTVDVQGPVVNVPSNGFPAMPQPNAITGTHARNGFTPNVQAQIRQDNNRAQDMANYARNPAAWHGAPPH
jgi:hypothetical protein